jgi:hypothetical protein
MTFSRPCLFPLAALALTLGLPQPQAQTVLYQEDFTGEEGKGQIGTQSDLAGVSWTIDTVNGSFEDNNDSFAVVQAGGNEFFQARDVDADYTDNEKLVTWTSPAIALGSSGGAPLLFAFEAAADGSFEPRDQTGGDVFDVSLQLSGGSEGSASSTLPLFTSSVENGSLHFGAQALTPNLEPFSQTIGSSALGSFTTANLVIGMTNHADNELQSFDQLSVTAIPEPSSSGFLVGAFALGTVLTFRWRRQHWRGKR